MRQSSIEVVISTTSINNVYVFTTLRDVGIDNSSMLLEATYPNEQMNQILGKLIRLIE